MAKNQARIGFGIDFNVNQQSLNNVKKALGDLKKMSKEDIEKSGGNIIGLSDSKTKSWKNDLGAMRKELGALEKAFEAAYNPKLGTYELNKFNASLKESGTSAQQAFSAVAAYGQQGQAALLDMTTNMLAVDRAAKQVNSTMKKLGDTMMNTIRWTITSTAINTVTGAIQQAYHYALDLDQSLNDIRIVTGKSADDMNKFAREANKAAKALGASTTDYTEASLIYYQQGLSDKDVKARTDTTIKTAAVTGQSASAVSEQLTAVWNGYKVSAAESEQYIDKLAAVAARTAADLEELSTGMSKVASAANIMGVDIDQLNAQLATIVSVTREAPESIGTALKTVYARMSDIEAGLDTETTLGEYTSQMAQMGINVLDANGKLRDMGAVVEEIGNKWTTLNREQQVSLAQSIAGTRQYSRMMALFDNWDMYQDAMTTSMESAGTLAKQHATYLESIEAHQEQLRASAEGLYDSIFDSDEIKGVYDVLAGIVTLVDELVQSLGGMPGLLSAAGMLFAKIAKNNIADLITKQQQNRLSQELNRRQLEEGKKIIAQQAESAKGNAVLTQHLNKVLELEGKIYDKANHLTDDQWTHLQEGVKAYNEKVQETIALSKKLKEAQEYATSTERLTFSIDQEGKYRPTNKRLTAGKETYNLSSHDDQEKMRQRFSALEEQGRKQAKGLAGNDKKEYERLKKYIELIDKENAELEEYRKIIKELPQEIKKLEEETDELGKSIEDTIDKDAFANKVTTVIDSLSTMAFTVIGVSSSITNLTETFRDSEAGLTDYLGALGGVAMSIGPMIAQFGTVKTNLAGVKAGTITGAAAWSAYWAAATMGITLVITALTTISSIISANAEKQRQARKEAIEDANTAIEEAKANQKLADSYLKLYEAYKESGEITDELRTAAEKLIEQYELEGYAIRLLCGDYEALAEKAQDVARIEREAIISNNQIKKENAAKQMKENITGGIRDHQTGKGYAIGTKDRLLYDIKNADEAKAIAQVRQAIDGIGALETFGGQDGNTGGFNIYTDGTPEKMAALYSALSKVYSKLPDTDTKDVIKRIIESESFSSGATSFIEANREIVRGQAQTSIIEKNYEKNIVSAKEFKADRERLIADATALGLNEDEAKNLVDQQYAAVGGNAYEMVLREQWLELQAEDEILNAGAIESMRNALDISMFSKADFAALRGFSAKKIANTAIDELIEDAKDKALQLQEQTWVDAKDARLANLEKQATRQSGQAKVNILKEELEIYKNVLEVQKATANETKENFFNLLEEKGLLEALDAEALLAEGNFEELQNRIHMLGDQNSDVSAELQGELLKVLQATNKISDAEQDAADARLAHFNGLFEASDLQLEYLDNANSLLEKQLSLYRLVKGESALLSTAMTGAMKDISSANLELTLTQLNLALKTLNEFEGDLNSEEGQDYISTTMATFEAYGDMLLSAAEKAGDIYANTVQALFDDFEKNGLKSLKTFEQITSEWDWTQEHEANYLDSVESEFAKQNLSYAFKEAVEKNKNIGSQKKINDLLQRELDALKEKDKLTQADFDRAQARLSVLQAQIALEEAQANKTQMRLVRGPGGAYSYQYVADESAVNEAEKNLTDANNEVYTTSKENLTSSIDEWKTLYQEWQDEIVAAKDRGASEEEIKDINRRYQEELETRAKLIQKQGEEWQRTMELIGMSSEEADKVVNSSIGSFIKGFANAKTDLSDLAGKITNAYSNYKTEVEGYLTTINDLLKEQQTLIDKLIKALRTAATLSGDSDSTSTYEPPKLKDKPEGDSYVPGDLAGGKLWSTSYVLDDSTISNWSSYLKGVNSGNVTLIDSSGGTFSAKNSDGKYKKLAFHLGDSQGRLAVDANGTYYLSVHPSDDPTLRWWIPYDKIAMWRASGSTAIFEEEDLRRAQVQAFDTGGYTGDWNSSDGRLAMLHKKEIVLDEDDTSNFLQALDILRSLNLSMLNSIAGMNSFYNNANTNWTNANTNISQTVEIKAEFPNVTDRNEIEEAFDNLVNLAAQHAFKNTHA